jgi:putative intracellular protease/amidase
MVVSSNGQGKVQPDYEFNEFSKAYRVFKDNGLAVDIASPKGGPVEADKYAPSKSHNAKVLMDQAIMGKLNNTLATNLIDAKAYAAVFVVGGTGAMFGLPNDKALQNVITQICLWWAAQVRCLICLTIRHYKMLLLKYVCGGQHRCDV